MRKYGEENFKVFYTEIIEEKLSYWDLTSILDELEGQYIDKYDSTNPEKGYNHNRRNVKSKSNFFKNIDSCDLKEKIITLKTKIKKDKKTVQIDIEAWKKLMLAFLIENHSIEEIINFLVNDYFIKRGYTDIQEK